MAVPGESPLRSSGLPPGSISCLNTLVGSNGRHRCRPFPAGGDDMLAALAAGASHPAVAGLLGLGAAGVAGGVVAMTWNVHVRQIRLAEQLARRQLVVTAQAGQAAADAEEIPAHVAEINGHGRVAAGARGEAARADAARGEGARGDGGR